MLSPIKVVDLELNQPLTDLTGLEGYQGVQALVRFHGVPLGYVQAPIVNGVCAAQTLIQKILEQHHSAITRQVLIQSLLAPQACPRLDFKDWLALPAPQDQGAWPKVTVAVCTRDRPKDLARCLNALVQLAYPDLDLLVVDNAPTTDATQEVVQRYPQVRYICEPRPGLDWARNRAILEAQGEIIAYTDDDVVVDAGWVKALARVFAENPEVMAVTGLVVPAELETPAQIWFEQQGGFGKGFEARWYRVSRGQKLPWGLLGTGQFGTGANMAYRRSLFTEIGGFDPALDVGTVTHGAGDLEMFFRVLKAGHTLVYEPQALVRHYHRRNYAQLRSQLTHHGSAYAYFVSGALHFPEETLSFLRLGLSWLRSGHVRPLLRSLLFPQSYPRDLRWAQLRGVGLGLGSYFPARKAAAAIAAQYPELPRLDHPFAPKPSRQMGQAIAVQTVDISQPLQPLTGLETAWCVRVFVTWQEQPLGSVEIVNQYQAVSVTRLATAIVEELGLQLLNPSGQVSLDVIQAQAIATLTQHYTSAAKPTPAVTLPSDQSVSIVIGTHDRPEDLRRCLQHLVAQKTPRSLEIIVVDNHPVSGLTPPVVSAFPGVKLVYEPRQGVAYARNAGITASRGDIIVTVDDDVVAPPGWLEQLIAPFARPDVMAVTGNVLPLELNTPAQQLFEQYGNGGLGRGFQQREVGQDWFECSWWAAVPTWELGGTANAAFRSQIFHDPEIGLMDEALGPGMPSGVGEDIYLFYKVLKAGYTIIYEPTAFVWHKHRQAIAGLKRQLYNYSKGFVSYHLTTWLRDGDWRALVTLFAFLPLYHLQQILLRLRRKRAYPLSLTWVEIQGNLAGAWSLWRSRQRVKQEGPSTPYIPVAERPPAWSSPPVSDRVPVLSSPV